MNSEEPTFGRALARSLHETWPALLLVYTIGIVVAWTALNRHRRLTLPWTILWTVFVLLGGLPGLFGYLYHRAWPRLTQCASCREKTPRDRPSCIQCGTELPTPQPQGIEVFA